MAKRPLFGPPLLRPFHKGERRPNADGSYSTEISMTAPDPSGQWMNFPSLWMGPNGPVQFQNEDDALNTALNFERFGSSFPRFATLPQAEKAAEDRSKAGGVGTGELAKPTNDKAGPDMAAPYGLLFPGFMGQRFALPMQDDLSRLPPDRGLIGGDMPGQGPLPGPYELAAMRRPTPARGQQPAPRLVSERRPAPQRQNAPAPDAMPQMMPAAPQASPQGAPAGPLGGLFQPENRDVLGALGVGLMRGDFSGGMADALKIKQGRAQENATRAWLMKRGLSAEDAAMAAQNPSIMSMLLKPGAVDEYKARAAAAIEYGMKPGTQEFQQFVLGNKFPDAGSGNLTDDIKEWQFAVQNGYKGTFTDWQTKSQRDQDPTFMREHTLRDEYDTDPNVKNFKAVRDNYKRVRSSATMDTGAGDVSLIFAYMKMLDPGSVVREGEFATAQNTGGIDDTIRNLYNGVVNGQRLTPEQRAKFVSAADQLYQGAVGTLTDTNKRFGDIAGGWQLDPGRIIQQPDKFEPLTLGVGESKDAGGGVTIKRLE